MYSAEWFDSIQIYRDRVDGRKGINGLAAIVESEMDLRPTERRLFLFTNRRRAVIKALYWRRTGFALWMMRLEQNRFPWPKKADDELRISATQFEWLLDGNDIWKMKPHETLEYTAFS